MVINRVSPLSVAKIAGMLHGIMGLVFGAIVSLIAMAGGMASNADGGALIGALFGVGAVVLLPIMYGGLGFVMTLLMAWLYNVTARIVGGVHIDVT